MVYSLMNLLYCRETNTFNYLISLPDLVVFAGETNFKLPSASSAIRIIPCDSIPLNFLGARFTSILTCLPMISSGL